MKTNDRKKETQHKIKWRFLLQDGDLYISEHCEWDQVVVSSDRNRICKNKVLVVNVKFSCIVERKSQEFWRNSVMEWFGCGSFLKLFPFSPHVYWGGSRRNSHTITPYSWPYFRPEERRGKWQTELSQWIERFETRRVDFLYLRLGLLNVSSKVRTLRYFKILHPFENKSLHLVFEQCGNPSPELKL